VLRCISVGVEYPFSSRACRIGALNPRLWNDIWTLFGGLAALAGNGWRLVSARYGNSKAQSRRRLDIRCYGGRVFDAPRCSVCSIWGHYPAKSITNSVQAMAQAISDSTSPASRKSRPLIISDFGYVASLYIRAYGKPVIGPRTIDDSPQPQ